MKKSELKQIIKEEIHKLLKEENEIFKAQDACKSVMFRLKPLFEKMFKTAKDSGYVDSYTVSLEPYNYGYMIRYNCRPNYRMIEDMMKKNKTIASTLLNSASVYLQPGSFFQSYFDEKKGYPQLEGNVFTANGKYESVQYPINSKTDIKPATERFFKKNADAIKIVTNYLEMN